MQARISSSGHVSANRAGELTLTLCGPGGCRETLTLKSQRRIPSRWLERGRPRFVTLGRCVVTLPPSGRAKVVVRLRPEHLAMLRRMRAIHAVAHVETAQARSRTAIVVHAPARRKARC